MSRKENPMGHLISLPHLPAPDPVDPDTDPLSGEQISEFLYYAQRLDQATSTAETFQVIRVIRNLVTSWPDG
jgi:hypothetical protein